jgi:FAD/FMN-containing dehydrogenase
VVAASEAQTAALWALRENVSEAQKIEGVSIKHDIAVPVSRIAEFIARADAALRGAFPGVRIVCFGHIGDGNLHYNQSKAGCRVERRIHRPHRSGQSHRARPGA